MIERKKLVVEPGFGVVRVGGDDAQHGSRHRRRVESAQHGQPLVALLHIKITEILIAPDRIADALVRKMRLAQRDPLGTKFGVALRKRHEIARKDGTPSRADDADDAVCRDVHHAELNAPGNAFAL